MDPLRQASLSTISEEGDRISEDDVFMPSLDRLFQETGSDDTILQIQPEVLHEQVEAACQEMMEREHRIERRGSLKRTRLVRETYYKRETRVRTRTGLRTETRVTVRIEETRTRVFHPTYKVISRITVDQCDQETPVIVEPSPESSKTRMGEVSSSYLSDTVPKIVY